MTCALSFTIPLLQASLSAHLDSLDQVCILDQVCVLDQATDLDQACVLDQVSLLPACRPHRCQSNLSQTHLRSPLLIPPQVLYALGPHKLWCLEAFTRISSPGMPHLCLPLRALPNHSQRQSSLLPALAPCPLPESPLHSDIITRHPHPSSAQMRVSSFPLLTCVLLSPRHLHNT